MMPKTNRRGHVITAAFHILHLFHEQQWVSFADIEKRLKCKTRTAKRWIKGMKDAGLPLYQERDPNHNNRVHFQYRNDLTRATRRQATGYLDELPSE